MHRSIRGAEKEQKLEIHCELELRNDLQHKDWKRAEWSSEVFLFQVIWKARHLQHDPE